MAHQFNEEQIAQFKTVFSIFDKHNEGSIRTKELKAVIQSLEYTFTEEQLNDVIYEFSGIGSGRIDFSQFLSIMARKIQDKQTEEELHQAFKLFDRGGGGLISVDDFKNVMESLGEKLTKSEINQMFKEADLDGDGFLNQDEFIKLLMAK